MSDTLDLPDWRYLGKRLDDDGYELNVEYTKEPDACQKCGVVGNLYRHGTKDVTYRDCAMWGKPTRLLVKVRRYKCRECGGTFLQPLEGIVDERRMTVRCAEYIQDHCLRDTFARLADHLGCDEKTVRNVASGYIAMLDDQFRPHLPEWLGIDETKLDGAMRCIITDVGENRPVDILPARDKDTLTAWLSRFKDRSRVRGIAIDMWRPYQRVAAEMFPGRPVVIDKFHVVRMAGQGLEKARIRIAKERPKAVGTSWKRSKTVLNKRPANLSARQRFDLDTWLDNEPDIATAYRLKEAFYGIYDLPKAEAIKAFDAWPASVPAEMKGDFKDLLSAMKNWRTEILAYFDHPISNAYTEALNGVTKVVNRAGRGYSYEVLRARILFKGRKPQAPEVVVKLRTAFRANEAQLKMMAMQQCHCLLCGAEAPLTHIVAIDAGEEVEKGLMCENCFRAFHTDRAKHHDSDSTQ